MALPGKKVNLFHYLDYRRFLRDWYEFEKRSSRLTFRAFSQKAGFTSPNFFKLVMDGERNLTSESLKKFKTGLDLNKQESEFFENLVFFNQSKTHEDKNQFFQKLLQSRKFNQTKPIEKEQYEFCSTWYHPVIRELIVSKDFDGTYEWLAKKIYPEITPNQAKKSVELMEHLGFLKKAGKNRWQQSQAVLSTGSESDELALLEYHQNLLGLVKDMVAEVPVDRRDVSALTLGIPKERLPLLKKKIQEFRQEILQMVATDAEPEEVVLLALQLVPLTQSTEKGTS